MNIVVVTDGIGVDIFKKWSDVEKHFPTMTKDDFVKEGDDFICRMDKESYTISKDIKLLETVAVEKVFGKQKVDWMTVWAVAFVVLLVQVVFK